MEENQVTTSEDSPVVDNQSYSDNQNDTAPEMDNADHPDVEETEDETEEVEFDGERYEIPKKLKDAFLMRQDYTKKTMEASEIRKQGEALANQASQREQLIQRNIEDFTVLNQLQNTFQQLNGLDLYTMSEQDPLEAQKFLIQKQQVEQAIKQVSGQISAREAQYQAYATEQVSAMRERGIAVLKQEIPGWNEQTASQLVDYAVSQGADSNRVKSILDPLEVKLLRKAFLYDQIMSKQAIKPSEQPKAKPVTKLGSKSSSSSNPENMTTDDWMKWRLSDLRKRKG